MERGFEFHRFLSAIRIAIDRPFVASLKGSSLARL